MTSNSTGLPPGAGATTAPNPDDAPEGSLSRANPPSQSQSGSPERQDSSTRRPTGTFDIGRDYSATNRALAVTSERSTTPSTATVIGAALVGAVAGASIPFMLSGRSSSRRGTSDTAQVRESVTINRPARELYDFWRDFTNLPRFMDNIKSVQELGEGRSHWVIKAPAGTSVEFDSRIVEDVPGKLIAWEPEPGASVANRGRVEFEPSSAPGATVVRTAISYDPPGGAAGRVVAKLFQREPAEQAREDLARFKQVMEDSKIS